jgi:SAM-dependent methyltransferase
MTPDTPNEAIWDTLVRNDILCSQPKLDLNADKAKTYLTRSKFYGEDLSGKNVLCLASGGGQQSIAFALLGATVTVVDFSTEQLKKDRLVAEKFGQEIRILKSDMRDLSMLKTDEFDVVYQPYSINYVPDTAPVFDEVSRVLKPGGVYDLMFHNPFVHGTWKDGCWGSAWEKAELWQEKGYPIWQPYRDGYPIQTDDPNWNFANSKDETVKIQSPQEYRHTLSTILNGLIHRGFEIVNLQEEVGAGEEGEVGSWEHYTSVAPPWMYLVCRKNYSK